MFAAEPALPIPFPKLQLFPGYAFFFSPEKLQ
jgi:hypothetical protein